MMQYTAVGSARNEKFLKAVDIHRNTADLWQ